MTVTIVAAVGRNGVIGVDGGLPWHLPDELRRFKELTMGHVLVMGRKTFESIGRTLPGRTTVVVTRRPEWRPDDAAVLVARSVVDAIETARAVDDDVFVVGGAEVYAAALSLTDRLALTFVDAEPDGDTFFPAVDWEEWRETARQPGDGWTQVDYERIASGR